MIFKNYLIGYLEGFWVGALTGGVAIGAIIVGEGHANHVDGWDTFFLALAAGAGGLIGGIPGLIIGRSYEYRFVKPLEIIKQ